MAETAVIETDLAIIGSGGGAFAAAIRASSLGRRVVMIERSTVGGACVNTGCVPSKALLAAADARHGALDASDRFPGISTSTGPVEISGLITGKDPLVEGMRSEKYVDLIEDYEWDLRQGEAMFTGTAQESVLEITGRDGAVETVRAWHYLVATGSAPWVLPIDGLKQVDYLTSTTAMGLQEVPESMIVLGGGYVALEQTQLFTRVGLRVTVLVRSRLLSKEEPEVSKTLMGAFADEGIQVVRRATVESVATDPATGGVVVAATTRTGRQEFTADRLLVATGRRAVTEDLGLGTVGVATGERGRSPWRTHW